ncbi:hypothetical protein [Enhygromyxa salina]|uniref:Uncharacterized protein n=1 Tax=Enhygromyxa salina TaxID=215803 RepID=A0A2S9YXZ9_9BACT|nr:hypothetical protein [Enhygromyxa salina]PRQ09975.1 hypothetical protein ENSA7_01810 [Enhygromyxa salina]
MNRTIIISLALAATAFALLGPVPVERTAAAQQPSSTVVPLAQEQAPTPAMSAGLCGLTSSDVADIVDYYALDPDMPAVADALSTPFDCDAYGDLCSALTTNQAHAYACGAWTDMKAELSIAQVNNRAVGRLQQWGTSCTPDYEVCEDICGSANVISCSGVWFKGSCHSIAMCDYFSGIDIKFLEILTPF